MVISSTPTVGAGDGCCDGTATPTVLIVGAGDDEGADVTITVAIRGEGVIVPSAVTTFLERKKYNGPIAADRCRKDRICV